MLAGLFVGRAGSAGAVTAPRADTIVRPGGSIQRAIDQTPAGGNVRISPGTSAESFLVTRTINLIGDRATSTATAAAPAPSPPTAAVRRRRPAPC